MKSILIIGMGRFGRHMARKFTEQGNEVMAVDNKESRINAVMSFVTDAQIADATDEQYIETLGVNNFDLCVVTIGEDFQASLEATSLLKDLGAPYVISRASRDVHAKFLLRNGADEVIYTEKETAERLAVKYGSDSIFNYIELTEDYSIYEITVPEPWIGKSIIDKNIRNKYNISILATKENDAIFPLPHPDHIFKSTETLMVMGRNEDVERLIK